LQSGSANPNEIKALEDKIAALKQDLECHQQEAQKSHEYYVEICTRTNEWNEIFAFGRQAYSN